MISFHPNVKLLNKNGTLCYLKVMAEVVSSQGFEYGVKHFYNQKSGFVSEILNSALNLNELESAALLKLGAIYINNQRQTQNVDVKTEQLFRVHTKPRRYSVNYDWASLVVFESPDFVVLNKPSGIPSHPAVDNILENALTQLSLELNQKLLITHRLDTLTAGLIVYAKTNLFVKSFNSQLQEKTIEKKYAALVETIHLLPKNVMHYMEPSPRAPKKVSSIYHESWLPCELEILEQKIKTDHSWLKINLLTGRTHQIRSQLSDLKAPILGDRLYGSVYPYKNEAIALRAVELQFNWLTTRHHFKIDSDF